MVNAFNYMDRNYKKIQTDKYMKLYAKQSLENCKFSKKKCSVLSKMAEIKSHIYQLLMRTEIHTAGWNVN